MIAKNIIHKQNWFSDSGKLQVTEENNISENRNANFFPTYHKTEPIKAYNIYAAKYLFWKQLEEYREETPPEKEVPEVSQKAFMSYEKDGSNPFLSLSGAQCAPY